MIMKNKNSCSMRDCEKVLRKLIEITSHENRRTNFNKLSEHFQGHDIAVLHQALETLDHMECVSLKTTTINYGFEKVFVIELMPRGVAYFTEKKHNRLVRWFNIAIGFISGILTTVIAELIIKLL